MSPRSQFCRCHPCQNLKSRNAQTLRVLKNRVQRASSLAGLPTGKHGLHFAFIHFVVSSPPRASTSAVLNPFGSCTTTTGGSNFLTRFSQVAFEKFSLQARPGQVATNNCKWSYESPTEWRLRHKIEIPKTAWVLRYVQLKLEIMSRVRNKKHLRAMNWNWAELKTS